MSAIVRPVIVLGAPRSGTTILRNCLALHPTSGTSPGNPTRSWKGPFHPAAGGYESNRVEAGDVDDALARSLREEFARGSINLSASGETRRTRGAAAAPWSGGSRTRSRPAGPAPRRSPATRRDPVPGEDPEEHPSGPDARAGLSRCALRAHHADAPDNIDSLIEGRRATDRIGPITRQRFARSGYPIAQQLRLRDYSEKVWKFALVPGWRDLAARHSPTSPPGSTSRATAMRSTISGDRSCPSAPGTARGLRTRAGGHDPRI